MGIRRVMNVHKSIALFLCALFIFSIIAMTSSTALAQDQYYPPNDVNRSNEDGSFEEEQQHSASYADLDEIMQNALRRFRAPAASLAVARNGRLVYAKGFGVANIETGERATAETLFNLASCTKAVSALGVLTLVDAGAIGLDQPVYDVLGRPPLPNRPDPRMFQVTVRQLLHHSAGWNDDSGYAKASKRVERVAPKGMPYEQAVTFALATPLDYTPGTDAKYANGDWNMIKLVIETVSRKPYCVYMKEVLASIGIQRMRGEHPKYFPGEAVRYDGFPPRKIPNGRRQVPLEPAFGNWMASCVDLARFLTALDGSRCRPPISLSSYDQMLAALPPPMVNRPNGSHYGLGLDAVKVSPEGVYYTKNGGKPGVHCQIEHLPCGANVGIFFNGGVDPDGSDANPLGPTLKQLRSTIPQIRDWPDIDMFSQFP